MEIIRKVYERRRITINLQIRGERMEEKVLFSICEDGMLMEPYDQFKAQLTEYISGHFDTESRIVLPERFCMLLNIQQAVSIQYTRDGSLFIKALDVHCVVCGSSKSRLYSIARNPNTYICEDCCRPKK